MRVWKVVVGTFAAIVAVHAAVTMPALAGPSYPAADPDPFYSVAHDLTAVRPGEVLKVQQMPPLDVFPYVGGPLPADVFRVQFRSVNSADAPIAAVTTLLVPHHREPDAPLFSFQQITNGLGTRCAPSKALYTTDPLLIIREGWQFREYVERGWVVAIPDHLGPTSAYGASRLGGHIVLDGIRAARNVTEAGVANSKVVMMGYSGGGVATGWAAALAPSYAPELPIVGVAQGGVPMNLEKMVDIVGVDPHPAFGLLMAAAIGLEREYPDRITFSSHLTPVGLLLRDAVANACTNELLFYGFGRRVGEVVHSASLINDPGAREVLRENSLEFFGGVPNAPVFEWHSPTDLLIPLDSIDATLSRYCRAGTPVQSVLTPAPEHLGAAEEGRLLAIDFLAARLQGAPVPSTC